MNLRPCAFDPAPFAACIESARDVQMRNLSPKTPLRRIPGHYREKWTRYDANRAVALRNVGWTYREIGALMGRTALAIQQKIGHLV